MTRTHGCSAWVLVSVLVGCTSPAPMPTPTSATPVVALKASDPITPATIALNEVYEIAMDGTFISGQWYCEIGNDPFPCNRFVVDVPRSGSVLVTMEFDGNEPMFIEMGDLRLGHDLPFLRGSSPLVARASVRPGPLPFRVGLDAPWGIPGYIARYRLKVTVD
jgi:hypothetical protein